jgi:hypothetical protein
MALRIVLVVLLGSFLPRAQAAEAPQMIAYNGDGSDLQKVIDGASAGAIITCDLKRQMELAAPLVIKKAMTLRCVNVALPRGVGNTSLIVVEAKGVTIYDSEFHGNYDSVSQKDRAPLVWFQAGGFTVERCTFHDGYKDGVMIAPSSGENARDIVGGVVQDIKAFRMGRDAVSISGGNNGLRIRDVTVRNIRLEKGYHRGAVEVSDGADNITVRDVYAQDAVYAIDVQDHGKPSAPNTNIVIEDVEAVRCRHIIRTSNGPRGHANLTLRNLVGNECAFPVQISNTKRVRIEQLSILNHTDRKSPPIRLESCHDVLLKSVTVQSLAFPDDPIKTVKCSGVSVQDSSRRE